MNVFTETLVSALVVIGALFVLLGSYGLARLPNFLMRLHAPTKATTLGVGALLLASAIYFTVTGPEVSLHEAAIVLFLLITAPVTAQLLAKAALHREGKSGNKKTGFAEKSV
ncbi:Na+/H+ antiporter subunit G [Propionivibrio sp.]|uniref:Na+/H+ antiporter subunit G n=1 Tax=Propionivibrio sp. TaxID=2212460 RepID=UPI003BF11299